MHSRPGPQGTQHEHRRAEPGRVFLRPPSVRAGLTAPATTNPATAELAVMTPPTLERVRVSADLVALTKPRVVLMVLVTTVVGYYVGLTGAPDYARLVHLLIGTMLAAGGTLALNQHWEREVDAKMDRTRARPLPDGRLSPLEALVFAAAVT